VTVLHGIISFNFIPKSENHVSIPGLVGDVPILWKNYDYLIFKIRQNCWITARVLFLFRFYREISHGSHNGQHILSHLKIKSCVSF
jgi:hypothetical protein